MTCKSGLNYLINLHNTVDLGNKPEASKEANRSCEQEEQEDDDSGVSKVEEGRCETFHLQLGEEVVYAVDEEVDGSEATREERSPPPVVVFCT